MEQAIPQSGLTENFWFGPLVKTVSYAIGLVLVLWAVSTATSYKLDMLRAERGLGNAEVVSTETRMRQLDCLTRNIYWEAASESFEGKVAVAQVTMNRWQSGRFADTLCGVIYQKNVFYERVICQFSWYCENTHRVRAVSKEHWAESEAVAKKVLLEGFRLPGLADAFYYHADYVKPQWNKPKLTQIGRHIFYGERT